MASALMSLIFFSPAREGTKCRHSHNIGRPKIATEDDRYNQRIEAPFRSQ